jgi:hypothetical protein
MRGNYRPLNNAFEYPPVKDDSNGRWLCRAQVMDGCGDHFEQYSQFLEAHLSQSGKLFTFRVSEFWYGEVKLGKCAMLNEDQVRELRDQLNQFLEKRAEDAPKFKSF